MRSRARSLTHCHRVDSSHPCQQGWSALLCWPGEANSPLPWVLQSLRGRGRSPTLLTLRSAFPSCRRWLGTRDKWGIPLSSLLPHDTQWGLLPHSHALRAGSPASTPPGPTLLFFPGKMQNLLSQVLQLVRCRVSSYSKLVFWLSIYIKNT